MVTIKTKEEIAILREGGRRHAAIMRELVKLVRPGVFTRELDAATVRLIAEFDKNPKTGKPDGDRSALLNFKPHGAQRPYPASICVSVNEEVVHGIPTEGNRQLQEGDIVSLDFSLVHCGMYTDMAVTVPVGDIEPKLAELIETTKKALLAGIKAAKGGKHIIDIATAVERVGRGGNNGVGYGVVEELVGHGVGYGVHEDPYVPNYISGVTGGSGGKGSNGGKGELLRPGMTLAVEPMFNLGDKDVFIDTDGYTIFTADGLPSAHFEHTILITKGNAEILTV